MYDLGGLPIRVVAGQDSRTLWCGWRHRRIWQQEHDLDADCHHVDGVRPHVGSGTIPEALEYRGEDYQREPCSGVVFDMASLEHDQTGSFMHVCVHCRHVRQRNEPVGAIPSDSLHGTRREFLVLDS